MRSVVFDTLRATAREAAQYVPEPIDRTVYPTDRLLFHCKGCDFIYAAGQTSHVDRIGHVCKGCQQKLVQMFLQ